MALERRSTPKSIRTREAIEAAARDLFARNGYDRTTVRDIGAQAGIDASMIIRYFGTKDALFARVTTPDLHLSVVQNVDPARVGEQILRHFLSIWEGDAGGGGMRVLLRSAASNDDAAARMRSVFMDQVVPALATIGPADTAATRAALVTTQLMGLAMTRYVLCLPPVVAMSPDVLIRAIGATIQSYAMGEHLE